MSKHEEFEDRLRKVVRPDRERFDVPEGYFADFKSRMLAHVKDLPQQPEAEKTEGYQVKINWWVLPALMAACLAMFVVFRPSIQTENESLDRVLSEIQPTPVEGSEILLDSTALEVIAETDLLEQYEYEVALEEVYSDDEIEQEDYLATLDHVEMEALEEFLLDNLNLYSEL